VMSSCSRRSKLKVGDCRPVCSFHWATFLPTLLQGRGLRTGEWWGWASICATSLGLCQPLLSPQEPPKLLPVQVLSILHSPPKDLLGIRKEQEMCIQ
jgi:hypothetical protein